MDEAASWRGCLTGAGRNGDDVQGYPHSSLFFGPVGRLRQGPGCQGRQGGLGDRRRGLVLVELSLRALVTISTAMMIAKTHAEDASGPQQPR